MHKQQSQVWELHQALGAYNSEFPEVPPLEIQQLRVKLIFEEFQEFCQASHQKDLVALADAIADLLVVTYGAACAWGIDIEPIWDEVHRTNMLKIGGPIREDGKHLKPEGWVPPNLEPLLHAQRKS